VSRDERPGARGAFSRVTREPVLAEDLIACDVPDYDWLIPGMMERGDRGIVTGEEGGGKSTFLRQVAVQAAKGIHPFDPGNRDADYPPVRVLIVDLENGARHIRRKLGGLTGLVTSDCGDRLAVVSLAAIDLRENPDADDLYAWVKEHGADLLITGPIYKMASGDPNTEEHARAISGVLDQIRGQGCSIMLEGHTPHANGGPRPHRPFGASLWKRWPEYGFWLPSWRSGGGQLDPWRGAREERAWPTVWRPGPGDGWPWMPIEPADRGDRSDERADERAEPHIPTLLWVMAEAERDGEHEWSGRILDGLLHAAPGGPALKLCRAVRKLAARKGYIVVTETNGGFMHRLGVAGREAAVTSDDD
jgi:hypothetical protein